MENVTRKKGGAMYRVEEVEDGSWTVLKPDGGVMTWAEHLPVKGRPTTEDVAYFTDRGVAKDACENLNIPERWACINAEWRGSECGVEISKLKDQIADWRRAADAWDTAWTARRKINDAIERGEDANEHVVANLESATRMAEAYEARAEGRPNPHPEVII